MPVTSRRVLGFAPLILAGGVQEAVSEDDDFFRSGGGLRD